MLFKRIDGLLIWVQSVEIVLLIFTDIVGRKKRPLLFSY